jgi:hypothetical protein
MIRRRSQRPVTRIDVAFVDDWEVRGDGSGDPRRLQFEPMRQLLTIFERVGIRGSFNVEVMQQLAFLAQGNRNPELEQLAAEWAELVTETYRRGHDVQLHIHPQWLGATYVDGRWDLPSSWSLPEHDPADVRTMIAEGIAYLMDLLGNVDPNYRCLTFRSGAWALAPSPFILSLLAEHGIVFDMSMVGGIRYRTRNVRLDYRANDEQFLPYYPNMADARRVSSKREPIVCIPTFRFRGPRRGLRVLRNPSLVLAKLRRLKALSRDRTDDGRRDPGTRYAEWDEELPTWERALRRLNPAQFFARDTFIADLAQLDGPRMELMLRQMRMSALSTGYARVPVILENHTKDIADFENIARFAAVVAADPAIEVVTLTEMANRLTHREYPIAVKR